ncbi:hypothetical protein DBY21_01885 [Candidatus Gastranaerophilales bacterium]|nr:MAG: hypothetical protein DBY21_01885 [Candidatus Gastranaerophilales bacterium]
MNSRGGGAGKNTLFKGLLDLKNFRFNRKKYYGFTLSEVLITLVIIGIVASMTLPSLIGKYQEKQWKVAYKKAYSSMSQAFLRMQEDGDFIDITPQRVSGENYYTPAIGENFKIISKYFNSVKTCFDGNADECWVCDSGQSGKFSSAAPNWLGCSKASYAFVDYSGMAWYLYSNQEFPILVDVNGNKNPNKLGKDRFVLRFASKESMDGAEGNPMNNVNYTGNIDRIAPWFDIINKKRWCPDGNCLYKSWLLE